MILSFLGHVPCETGALTMLLGSHHRELLPNGLHDLNIWNGGGWLLSKQEQLRCLGQ